MRSKTFLLAMLVIFIAALGHTAAAQEAISDCPPHPTAMDSYDASSSVVIAKITSVKLAPKENGVQIARSIGMDVVKVYKGTLKPGDKLKFAGVLTIRLGWMMNDDWVGSEMLLYLTPEQQAEELWKLPVCSRSSFVELMAADLHFLNNIKEFQGRTRLSGTVSLWEGEAEPATGITVRIIGGTGAVELQTDAQGVYELYDLPAGSYEVEVIPPAGWKSISEFDSGTPNLNKAKWKLGSRTIPIIVEAGKQANVDLFLQPDNAIRGRIVDDRDRPIARVYVRALPWGKDPEDEDALEETGAYTNSDGSFAIENLPAGRYQLWFNAGGTVSAATPFRPFYYPTTPDRSQAWVFVMKPGQVYEGLTIRPREVMETVVISGRMVFANDAPAVHQPVGFTPENGGYGNPPMTDAEGRFTLRVVKGSPGVVSGSFFAREKDGQKCAVLPGTMGRMWFPGWGPRAVEVPVDAQADTADVLIRIPFARCEDPPRNPSR